AAGLTDLGMVHPTSMGSIAPSYLWRYRDGGQFAVSPAH
ncbi:MAG: complex I NDUFA9 subunit family protein, partial [Brevundimonas sp.]